jgi:TP901-1 family phage major tail protein
MAAFGGKDFLLKMGNGATGAVTFQDSGDTVTKSAHGLLAGDIVSFSDITTTTGIVEDTEYYVVNPSTNTFQVAATEGGSALTLTTDGTGTLSEGFRTVGGLRSTSMAVNAEAIDVTNQGSNQWKELLDGAGIKSVSISGSGVFEQDSRLARLRANCLNQTLTSFRVVEHASGDYFQGSFKITSLERAGDYNNEQTWSISLESSGAVAYTAVA